MRLAEIRLHRLRIPLVREFSHSLHSWNRSEAILAVIADDTGATGVGEGAPRGFVTGETAEAAAAAVAPLARCLAGRTAATFDAVRGLLESTGGDALARRHPAAWCALETACLDLWAKTRQVPLHRLFSDAAIPAALTYSAVVPLTADEPDLSAILAIVRSLQIRQVKVKVNDIAGGIAALTTIRRELGPAAELRVDANAAFTPGQALAFLKAAAGLELAAFEQPTAKDDLDGLARVARSSPVPVFADESMYTDRGPEYLVENRLCHGLNIRLSSCGGFFKTLRLVDRVRARGLMFQIGAHVGETAVLSMAGRHLAALCPDHRFLEGSFSRWILKEDVGTGEVVFGTRGQASLPPAAGLGIGVKNALLQRWSEPLAVVT
jgi:L-alanine-DL-glutamate epimerase-like enolase superfamily enzyme